MILVLAGMGQLSISAMAILSQAAHSSGMIVIAEPLSRTQISTDIGTDLLLAFNNMMESIPIIESEYFHGNDVKYNIPWKINPTKQYIQIKFNRIINRMMHCNKIRFIKRKQNKRG